MTTRVTRWATDYCAASGKKPNATANWILCFAFTAKVPQSVRTLFHGLFESFLARRNLTVMRYEPVRCKCGHLAESIGHAPEDEGEENLSLSAMIAARS